MGNSRSYPRSKREVRAFHKTVSITLTRRTPLTAPDHTKNGIKQPVHHYSCDRLRRGISQVERDNVPPSSIKNLWPIRSACPSMATCQEPLEANLQTPYGRAAKPPFPWNQGGILGSQPLPARHCPKKATNIAGNCLF